MPEPEIDQQTADAIASKLGLDAEVELPETSKNERAERIVGRRPEGVMPVDMPGEQGYRCPVCLNAVVVNGEYDERLQWSEYKGFLWCEVCDYDYPSALCVPLDAELDQSSPWVHAAGRDAAVDVFLATVEQAREGLQRELDAMTVIEPLPTVLAEFEDPAPCIRCAECGHLYATARDLQAAWERRMGSSAPPADSISGCMECLHDF